MTIILFTEDDVTGEAIRILPQKSLMHTKKHPKIIRRRVNRGHIFNPRKIAGLIKFAIQKEKTKIIVCVDSECTDPKITERNLEPCKKAVKALGVAVHFVVVVHALETWLAADDEALRIILKPKKEIRIPGNLESECHPEGILKDIFRKHGRDFIKSKDDSVIADHADPARIAQRCASFRKFQQVLLS